MRRWLAVLCLGLTVLTPSAQAEWVPKVFLKNDGGLNDGYDPISIEDKEAADIQNMIFSTGGDIVKRNGISPMNTTPIPSQAAFTGVAFLKLSSGTRELVATTVEGTTTNPRLWKMDYGSGTMGPMGTWNDITGALSLNGNVDNHTDFCVAQDQIVITNGLGNAGPSVWGGVGNATALGGSPPNAAWCEYHKNFLWVAGNTGAPSQLAFSNSGSISTWTGSDTINVETNDGQIIRGLKSGLDCLYVFKDLSIWRVCGTDRDSFTNEQMVRGFGTLSNNSIQLINNRFIFLTSEGQVAVYDGGINIEIISAKIQGTLRGINRNRLSEAESAAIEDQTGNISYYLALSTSASTKNDLILVYDTSHRAWTKFTGMSANAMAPHEMGTTQRDLAFGDYTGTMWHYPSDGTSDFGSAINAYYLTKQFSFPEMPQNKTWRRLEVLASQQGNYSLTVQTRSDFEGTGATNTVSLAGSGAMWDTAVWDSDVWADLSTTIGSIATNKRKRFFQALFQSNAATQPVTIKGYIMWIEPEGVQ